MSLRRIQHRAPTPTLPARGEGVAAPPPSTGEVGRGACCKTNASAPNTNLVPPASQGEPSHASTRFPLPAGGTLRRGFSVALVFINFAHAVGITKFLSYVDGVRIDAADL